ncbi:hypothetical protein CspeluHIS016_0304120 [Cutaneotrichosporon spelunceum]|uniref:Uncharacterized protein n=1 Tax=Cutaneotrichosporon spelunceum TaxID=1672016 RepID=A0AAD3YC43_9TREE|nr:hypothetical protein CspeluHIS016_0304120 [Cutaneotrichosporon spelunceum]
MVICHIISSTIRAATDAHSDWKHGLPPRRGRSLIYKPVYKLTIVIERKVNPRPPTVAYVRSLPDPSFSDDPSESRIIADVEDDAKEVKDVDDMPPPYPGTSTGMPPRYIA